MKCRLLDGVPRAPKRRRVAHVEIRQVPDSGAHGVGGGESVDSSGYLGAEGDTDLRPIRDFSNVSSWATAAAMRILIRGGALWKS